MNGYCVRCHEEREITDPVQVTMRNGRPATDGHCPVCGTRIYRLGHESPAPAREAK